MLKTGYISVDYIQGDISTYKGFIACIKRGDTLVEERTFFTSNIDKDRDSAQNWVAKQECYTSVSTKSFKEFHKELSLVNQKNEDVFKARYLGETIPEKFTFGEIYKVLKIEKTNTKIANMVLSVEDIFNETEAPNSIWYVINNKGKIERIEDGHCFAIIPEKYPFIDLTKEPKEIVEDIVVMAIRKKASDIHINTFESGVFVLISVNGQIFEEIIKKNIYLVNTIKSMCVPSLANTNETKPAISSFELVRQNMNVIVRVSIMPAKWGPKVNLRLLL